MSLIRVTGGNSVPATGSSVHFDTYKGSVAQSLEFTSQAQVDALCPNPDSNKPLYIAGSKAIRFALDGILEPGGVNIPSWSWGQAYGYDGASNLDTDVWFQWEYKFSGAFNDVATYAPDLDRHKTHYLYLSNSAKWTWRHEYRTTANDCVGHLTINAGGSPMQENTTYSPHFNNHPFGDGEGVRYNVTYSASDHLNDAGTTNPGPFLTLPDKWVRVTCHVQCQNKLMRAWMSDEDNDPVQIISADGDLNTGWDFSAQESDDCVWDEMRITYDTSQEDTDDGIPDNNFVSGNIGYIWNRFFLMDTSEIPRGGKTIP